MASSTSTTSNPSNNSSADSDRLRELAEHDWLTGLYNRRAVEEAFTRLAKEKAQGIVLLLSIQNLGQLNNRFGHLTGDQILKETARILGFMFSRRDLIGRLEGDEFLIFSPGAYSADFLESKIMQLKNRFRSITLPSGISCRLTVYADGGLFRPGDTYRALMRRIDNARLERERSQQDQDYLNPPGVVIDLKCIQQELCEQEMIPGAYCQDYESFKSIYRFVERGLRRSGREAFTILITLTDEDGTFIPLDVRKDQMQLLGTLIQNNLRIGDVYTQYSSCQYLVMVLDASAENANMIGMRIRQAFLEATEVSERFCLLHAVYPVKSSRAK